MYLTIQRDDITICFTGNGSFKTYGLFRYSNCIHDKDNIQIKGAISELF